MALKKATDTAASRPVEARECARDTAGLIEQLGDDDATVRREAARELATRPEAATPLCACLAHEPDMNVRSALFSSASRLGGDVVVRALVPMLRSEDPNLRNGAIEVLAGLPDVVAPHIELLLRDADSDVRIFTVNLLGDLQHPRVPHWLSQVLLHDDAVNVVGAALDVLAEVGTQASLPAMRSAAMRFSDDAYIGFAVDLAAERIGTP